MTEPTAQARRTAAIVVIGDEILSGKTVDTNTPFLLGELRALGVDVRRVIVVPDVVADIVEAIRLVASRFDFVFTSGGVGPTHDDVTVEAIAAALGRPVVRDPELERMIRALYPNKAVGDVQLRMADVPAGTELVHADGLRVPLLVCENIYILPGIPEIFREKFLAVRERFRCAPYHLAAVYCTRGEGYLAPFMAQLVAEFPEVAVGSYPTITESAWRVKVTLESKDPAALERALGRFRELVGEGAILRVEP